MEKRYRILLAEDNPINVQVAQYILTPLSDRIDVVWNGEEAIEKLQSNRYDLVLMDVKMPVLDGYEATAIIREWEKNRTGSDRIPIIAMTAGNTYEDEKQCLDAGMDGFLAKPFNLSNLKILLNQLGL